ncbi:MAG: hypothetical protein P8J74_06550 [Woeseiaceae bacterium]|jgi:hypothetical protein|nr:hypothetical protein [Woeseiaceae bacterium]
MKNLLATGILLVTLSGCATTYTTDNFSEYQSAHKTLAITPFVVSIDMNSENNRKGLSGEDLLTEETIQSLNFQRAFYTEFSEGVEKKKVTVSFQDIDDTNASIQKADSFDEQGKLILTKQELGELLKVDAVISGSVMLRSYYRRVSGQYRGGMTKPLSINDMEGTGGVIESSLMVGWGVTNEATINLAIHDSFSGALVWSYERSTAGGAKSSPQRLVQDLMRNVALKFPYKASSAKR